jgi:hypothetical protein
MTTDIASENITRMAAYGSIANINFSQADGVVYVSCFTILTRGGPVLVGGNGVITCNGGKHNFMLNILCASTNGFMRFVDVNAQDIPGGDQQTMGSTLGDSVAPALWTYKLGVSADGGNNHNITNVNLFAIELLR